MFDLSAIKESHATVDLVGNARCSQCLLKHPTLGIGAVQNGHFVTGYTARNGFLNFLHAIIRLLTVAVATKNSNAFTVTGTCPKVLTESIVIVGNQIIGRIQNMAEGAVILLELN